jgi:hypothetical protein
LVCLRIKGRSRYTLKADRRNHANGARWSQITLYDELKRPDVDGQTKSIHAIRQDYPLSTHCRINSGEIKHNFVAVSCLDDDNIGEFYAVNSFAGRRANFRQHVTKQRALKDMAGLVLTHADFDPWKLIKFGQHYGGSLTIKSHMAARPSS